MEMLYFAFANDNTHATLKLDDERQAIEAILAPLKATRNFDVFFRSPASVEQVILDLVQYKDQIKLFHFSGHGGPHNLVLSDGETLIDGIYQQLAECPNLDLVVLNACSTFHQVKLLHDLNIPLVIATPQDIADHLASAYSRSFYKSLSYYNSLDASFTVAKNVIMGKNNSFVFFRGQGLPASGFNNEPWSLYSLDDQVAKNWYLPSGKRIETENFIPNESLITSLFNALLPFSSDLQALNNSTAPVELFEKREAIVKVLPRPIGLGIRKLVARSTTQESAANTFYDKPGKDRLKQLLRVFETSIELMVFILLSQLWNILEDQDWLIKNEKLEQKIFILPPAVRTQILAWFQREVLDLKKSIDLIVALREVFDQFEDIHFVKELKHLKLKNKPGLPFYEACLWLSNLHLEVLNTDISELKGQALSLTAELKLCNVLEELGFIAAYSFTSIKNIDVIKYRGEKSATFNHKVVELIPTFTGLGEGNRPLMKFLYSKSVIIERKPVESIVEVKSTDNTKDLDQLLGIVKETAPKVDEAKPSIFTTPTELNLSPFCIDENAFNPKEPKLGKLHFFQRYQDGNFIFRFLDQLDSLPLIVSEKNPNTAYLHKVLNKQFESFLKLINR